MHGTLWWKTQVLKLCVSQGGAKLSGHGFQLLACFHTLVGRTKHGLGALLLCKYWFYCALGVLHHGMAMHISDLACGGSFFLPPQIIAPPQGKG